MPLLCAFVSYAHFIAGRECGDTATHTYANEPICARHFAYVSHIYMVCRICDLPSYLIASVFQQEHTCAVGDMGGDCMHFEGDYYCTCEAPHGLEILAEAE